MKKSFFSKFLPIKIFGANDNGVRRGVDVIFDETTSLNRLAVDQVVKIESLRSFSDIADNWFFINSVGGVGDTITLEIDSGDGAFDVIGAALFSKVFTTAAGEDRNDLCDRILSELNADADFLKAYRATRVKDSPIIIVKSIFFGEWSEVFDPSWPTIKPDAFRVITTGTISAPRAFGDFKRRNKLNSISVDPRDERFGQIGVSGSVSIGGEAKNFYDELFTEPGGSNDMSINAANTDVVFSVPVDPLKDLEIYEIRMFFSGNGINLGQAFGSGQALTDGILLRFKSDNEVKVLGPFFTNSDLKNLWSVGSPTNFRLDKPSGKDELLASFRPGPPIVLRKSGTFGDPSNDDYLEIILRDRFDNITDTMQSAAIGFKSEF